MMIHPGDEDHREAQDECEDRWAETFQREPQLTVTANPFCGGNFDVDDEECQRDGKDAVTERLEPCVWVRFCHAWWRQCMRFRSGIAQLRFDGLRRLDVLRVG